MSGQRSTTIGRNGELVDVRTVRARSGIVVGSRDAEVVVPLDLMDKRAPKIVSSRSDSESMADPRRRLNAPGREGPRRISSFHICDALAAERKAARTAQGDFSGTITGGNGGSDSVSQEATYQFDVPSGVTNITANVDLANDANDSLSSYLIAPDGTTQGYGENDVDGNQ